MADSKDQAKGDGDNRRAARVFTHPVRDQIARALWDEGTKTSVAEFSGDDPDALRRARYHFRVMARATIVYEAGTRMVRGVAEEVYGLSESGRTAFLPTTA